MSLTLYLYPCFVYLPPRYRNRDDHEFSSSFSSSALGASILRTHELVFPLPSLPPPSSSPTTSLPLPSFHSSITMASRLRTSSSLLRSLCSSASSSSSSTHRAQTRFTSSSSSPSSSPRRQLLFPTSALTLSLALYLYYQHSSPINLDAKQLTSGKTGIPSLKSRGVGASTDKAGLISAEELGRHTSKEEGVWVVVNGDVWE